MANKKIAHPKRQDKNPLNSRGFRGDVFRLYEKASQRLGYKSDTLYAVADLISNRGRSHEDRVSLVYSHLDANGVRQVEKKYLSELLNLHSNYILGAHTSKENKGTQLFDRTPKIYQKARDLTEINKQLDGVLEGVENERHRLAAAKREHHRAVKSIRNNPKLIESLRLSNQKVREAEESLNRAEEIYQSAYKKASAPIQRLQSHVQGRARIAKQIRIIRNHYEDKRPEENFANMVKIEKYELAKKRFSEEEEKRNAFLAMQSEKTKTFWGRIADYIRGEQTAQQSPLAKQPEERLQKEDVGSRRRGFGCGFLSAIGAAGAIIGGIVGYNLRGCEEKPVSPAAKPAATQPATAPATQQSFAVAATQSYKPAATQPAAKPSQLSIAGSVDLTTLPSPVLIKSPATQPYGGKTLDDMAKEAENARAQAGRLSSENRGLMQKLGILEESSRRRLDLEEKAKEERLEKLREAEEVNKLAQGLGNIPPNLVKVTVNRNNQILSRTQIPYSVKRVITDAPDLESSLRALGSAVPNMPANPNASHEYARLMEANPSLVSKMEKQNQEASDIDRALALISQFNSQGFAAYTINEGQPDEATVIIGNDKEIAMKIGGSS